MNCNNCYKRLGIIFGRNKRVKARTITKNDISLAGHRVDFCSIKCFNEFCEFKRARII